MSLSRSGLTSLTCLVLASLAGCGGNGGTEPGPTTGTISGSVTADGEGIAEVGLALSPGGSLTTDANGAYQFEDLQPGDYTLTIDPPGGFLLAEGEPASRVASVAAGATTTVNWSLVEEGSNGEPGAEVVEIRLTTANRFSPDDVTISAGTQVRWINDSSMLHTVTPDDPEQEGVWTEATTSSQGVVLEHVFSVEGESYDYHCEPHLGVGMVGRIVVQ